MNLKNREKDLDLRKVKEKLLKLDKQLNKHQKIKFIFLYGSKAELRDTPLSDIDIAVYYEGNEEERFQFRMKALGELPNKADLQIFQDLPLIVKKEIIGGKVLYYLNYRFLFEQCMKEIKEFNTFEKYYNEYLNELKKEIEA
ncbi:MAG: nucleotidyltransferase domain-containing protein [Nanoarchaeota archaeon]